jgi:hypothetical protein
MGMNKLAAIFNVFDGEELLEGSIRQILPVVDTVIAVVQTTSNWGEYYEGGKNEVLRLHEKGFIQHIIEFKPSITNERLNGCKNETNKRSLGLELARQLGFTHFLFLDCDEYYDTFQFGNAWKKIIENNYHASACYIQAYEKSPLLAKVNLEEYYVPFIHKIETTTQIGFQKYPYYCDPTRTTNHLISHLFPTTEILMHHFTSIRADIDRKYRNSSAKMNFNQDEMLQTYAQIKVEETERLKLVPNNFGIDVNSTFL